MSAHFYIRNPDTANDVVVSDEHIYQCICAGESLVDLLLAFSPQTIAKSPDLRNKIAQGVLIRQDDDGNDVAASEAFADLEYKLLTEICADAVVTSNASSDNPVATIADVTAASYGIKGAVDTFDDLPSEGVETGDIYIVRNDSAGHYEGFYRFDGSDWVFLSRNTGAQDHGELDGLGDDDHLQYHNDARGDVRYFPRADLQSSAGAGFIGIADANNVFESTTIEGALQECGVITSKLKVSDGQLYVYDEDSGWISCHRLAFAFSAGKIRSGFLNVGEASTWSSGFVIDGGIITKVYAHFRVAIDGILGIGLSGEQVLAFDVRRGHNVEIKERPMVKVESGYLQVGVFGHINEHFKDVVVVVEIAEMLT